jgi:signal transduction histidine kinase
MLTLERKIQTTFATALAALLAIGLMAWLLAERSTQAARTVDRIRSELAVLQSILISLPSLDAGVRGYVVSGNPAFLDSYRSGVQTIRGALDALTAAGTDPARIPQVTELRSLVNRHLRHAENAVCARLSGDQAAAAQMVAAGTDLDLLNPIRALIAPIEDTEQRELELALKSVRRQSKLTTATVILGGTVSAALVSLFGLQVLRDLRLRLEAEAQLAQRNASLEAQTARLTEANRDLESFSYSVSHDLRAPLRGIDGFSRILMEDYGAQFDAEGRRLLGVVRDEARRMGRLIDALLNFSRVGRQQMRKGRFRMNELTADVIAELTRAHPGSTPRFTVRPLPDAWGDRDLVRQVLVNLIGNAMKFSAGKPDPHVEIEGSETADSTTYSVRDNGAGFDPRHSDKLFRVFHRLHGESEFEGTGVGLALVHRIVSRHRGRVEGEGRPDHGAVFRVTLPKFTNDPD